MGRRQYGSGTVYQRTDGRWIGRAEAGWTANGTRRRVSVSGKTEAEAKRKLRDKLRTIHEDEEQVAGRKLTVKQWSEIWLPLHAQRVRPNHAVNTKSMVNRWIIPTIGHRRLEQLTPADARAVEAAVRDAGRKGTTAAAVVTALRTMLKDARIEGHKVPDGILDMRKPELSETDRDAIPTTDVHKILRKADGTGELPRWILAFYQGMRQAEVLGLTWDCVDLDKGLVDVSWQLRYYPAGTVIPERFRSKPIQAGFHLMRPKTKAGERVIPLSPPAWEALKAWKNMAPDNPWNLVFTARDMRTGKGQPIVPRDPRRDRTAWYDLQKAAEVQKGWTEPTDETEPEPTYWTIHEARHSTATLLILGGIDPATVAAILGQRALVRAYVHMKAENLRPAIDSIAGELDWKKTATA